MTTHSSGWKSNCDLPVHPLDFPIDGLVRRYKIKWHRSKN